MSNYTRGIVERSAFVIAIALFLWGWKWTTIGVGPANLMHDDGYSVTGGFLMFFGGVIIGRYVAIRTKLNETGVKPTKHTTKK